MQPALLSSERMDWNTPQCIVDGLNAMGGVALDPCSNANSIVGARVEWKLSERALELEAQVESVKEYYKGFPNFRNPKLNAIDKAKRALAECLADPAQTENGLRDPWGEIVTDLICAAYQTKQEPVSLVYVNPPYGSALADWAPKIAAEANAGLEIVALVPSRTDTDWFHTLWESARTTLLWKGRLKFLGAKYPAPFPSALFYFGKREEVFIKAFADKGIFIQ
jgi:hypothetical protein